MLRGGGRERERGWAQLKTPGLSFVSRVTRSLPIGPSDVFINDNAVFI